MNIYSIFYNSTYFFNKTTNSDGDNNVKLSTALVISLISLMYMGMRMNLFKSCKCKSHPRLVQETHPPLMDLSKTLEIMKVAHQILEDLFKSYNHPKADRSEPKKFSFTIYLHKETIKKIDDKSKLTPPLLVKFKSGTNESSLPLLAILNAIEWNKLDSKCANIEMKNDHYLESYTGKGYKSMNTFLRTARLRKKDIPNFSWNCKKIDSAAKERLFICLNVARSLNEYPSVPQGTIVHRKVKSAKAPDLMNKYEVGNIVTEESFISTQQPEGIAFISGDIEYNITTALNSRGKAIQTISINSHEKECLFLPYTSFKVEKVQYLNKFTGNQVDPKTEPKQLLSTNIRKIIELSEVPSY